MRRLLLLLLVGLFLVGCGGSPATETTADTSGDDSGSQADADAAVSEPSPDGTTASEPSAAGASERRAAPFGTVTLVDGSTLDGADYAGDSLALWFWAPW